MFSLQQQRQSREGSCSELEGEGGAQQPWADLNNTTDPTSNTINFVATSTLPVRPAEETISSRAVAFLDGHQEL